MISGGYQPGERHAFDAVAPERSVERDAHCGEAIASTELEVFLAALEQIPLGFGEGSYDGRRYGVTVNASQDGKRLWLFGRELGGADFVSFNLYRLTDGRLALRPCEMPAEKVIEFVAGYRPSRCSG